MQEGTGTAAPSRVPLLLTDALTAWQFAPLVSVLLIGLAAAYLAAVALVARRGAARAWAGRRTAAFLLGLAVIAVATQSSIGVYDDVLFSVHMVQHLLLIMVAPPLLIYGSLLTDLHQGGLVMFAGSDLIMAALAMVLAAVLVRARNLSRSGLPGDLDAYNAYLAGLGRRDVGAVRVMASPGGSRTCLRLRKRGGSSRADTRATRPIR